MDIVALDRLDMASLVRPGDRVMWGQAGAEPLSLTRALLAQRHAVGPFRAFIGASWCDTVSLESTDVVRFESYCAAADNRKLAKAGALDILPCHYSQLPSLIRSGALRVDVLLLQVAPVDDHGRYSLSVAHEYLIAALDTARVVVVEINHRAPRTFGERSLTADDIDLAVVTDRELVLPSMSQPNAAECAAARRVADLIHDGYTLQVGIGTLPEAVLRELGDRRDLGVHTGALTDQIALLARAGVVTNSRKSIDRGVTIAGVMMGGRAVYEYAHDNRLVCFRSVDYTHSHAVLAKIDHFAAINSAVEVDLTGQINAEVAGGVYIGAVGGAVDFIRGAARSKGGLPIVALPSIAGKPDRPFSRIVAHLSGPVSTPRADAGIIVTEHGIADLRGMSIKQRIDKMLGIADPRFHDDLQKSGRAMKHPPLRVLRSLLFAPGNHARRVEKALGGQADTVILDLEDSVPASAKAEARAAVADCLRRGYGNPAYVRINALGEPGHLDDLRAIVGLPLAGIVAPKVDTVRDLMALDGLIGDLESQASLLHGSIDLMPIIESASGLMNAQAIGAAVPRVHRMIFGGIDYAHDLNLEVSSGEPELAHARAQLAQASRCAGLEPPIDTVVVEIRDFPLLRSSAIAGRRMGFQGKLCIHPDQVAICNEVFTPDTAAQEHAQRVLDAFAVAEAAGSAAIQVDGFMVDYPVVKRAQRVLAIAEHLRLRAIERGSG